MAVRGHASSHTRNSRNIAKLVLGGSGDLAEEKPLKIKKVTLHDQVVDFLRDLVIEGHLEPGSRIDEAHLVEQLGVSRTPFREALRTLAAEGLVVIQPARGSLVRRFSQADVFSILEVLAELERLAGQTACERASDDEIRSAVAIHEEMMGFFRARERLPYFKLNQQFHTDVVAMSRNPTLVQLQGSLQAQIKRIRFIGNETPEKWAGAADDHERMVAALAARDGAALGREMAQHMRNTWERVRDRV